MTWGNKAEKEEGGGGGGKQLHSAHLLFQCGKLVCWRRATVDGDSRGLPHPCSRAQFHTDLLEAGTWQLYSATSICTKGVSSGNMGGGSRELDLCVRERESTARQSAHDVTRHAVSQFTAHGGGRRLPGPWRPNRNETVCRGFLWSVSPACPALTAVA